MKGIGKPCTGKLFARFDEGGLALPALYSTLMFAALRISLLLDLQPPTPNAHEMCTVFIVMFTEVKKILASPETVSIARVS